VAFEQVEEAEDVDGGCYDIEAEFFRWVLTEIRVLQENPDEHDWPVRPNNNEYPVGKCGSEEREADDPSAHGEEAPEEHWDHCDTRNVRFVR